MWRVTVKLSLDTTDTQGKDFAGLCTDESYKTIYNAQGQSYFGDFLGLRVAGLRRALAHGTDK